jgi:hypothetical protein
MHIFIDVLSNKEVCTDVLETKEVQDGLWLAAQGKMILVGGESFDLGSNPSAEDEAEALADGAVKKVNVVHNHSLFKIGALEKKLIKKYYKDYWKLLIKHFEDDAEKSAKFKEDFKKINGFLKKHIFADLDAWEFYLPEDSDGLGTGMLIAAKWGSEEAPCFYYPLIGMRQQRV